VSTLAQGNWQMEVREIKKVSRKTVPRGCPRKGKRKRCGASRNSGKKPRGKQTTIAVRRLGEGTMESPLYSTQFLCSNSRMANKQVMFLPGEIINRGKSIVQNLCRRKHFNLTGGISKDADSGFLLLTGGWDAGKNSGK